MTSTEHLHRMTTTELRELRADVVDAARAASPMRYSACVDERLRTIDAIIARRDDWGARDGYGPYRDERR